MARALVILAALAGGCSLGLPIGDRCEVDDDCLTGRRCVDQTCVEMAKVCDQPACALYSLSPAVAEAGDTVELEGIFGSAIEVHFPRRDGDVRGTLISRSSHRAEVEVPAGADAGQLYVTSFGRNLGSLPFRRASFTPAVAAVRPEQTTAARTRSTLIEPRTRFALASFGDYVFAIGGEDANGTPLDTVERATLNADGTLSQFSYAGALLKTARTGASVVVAGPWLFVVGGVDRDGKALATIERTRRLPDGSIDVFVPAGSLRAPRSDASAALIGNRLTIAGGRDASGALVASVESAHLAADGTVGELVAESAHLDVSRARAASLVADGAWWLIGGEGPNGPLETVERGGLADARVEKFLPGGSFATPRAGASAIRLGKQVFLFGGDAGGEPISAIERAPVGLQLDFSPVGSLRSARSDARLVANENDVHLVGGRSAAGALATVETVPFDGNAVLGSFEDAGALSTTREGAAPVVLGRFVYLLGGREVNLGPNSEIYRAPVAADGWLGKFEHISALNNKRTRHAVVVVGSSIYVIGGSIGGARNEVPVPLTERAEIGHDGTLGAFEVDSALTPKVPRYNAGVAVLGDYLYLLGGQTAFTTPIKSIERARIANGRLEPFELAGELILARYGSTQIVDGDTLYLGGGMTISETTLRSIERVRWSGSGITVDNLAAEFQDQRQNPGSIALGGRWYVLGGYTNSLDGASFDGPLQSVELASVLSDGMIAEFERTDLKMLKARYSPAAIAFGNWAYAFGGLLNLTEIDAIDRAPLLSGN